MANGPGIKEWCSVTMIASGACYKYGLVDLSSAKTVAVPSAATTKPFGVCMDDAADGEPVRVLLLGIFPGIDCDGDLNNGDFVLGKDNTAEYHKLEASSNGTTAGTVGRVIDTDSTLADDEKMVLWNFINNRVT